MAIELSSPRDLAALIDERWPQEPGSEADRADLRPDRATLTELIRVCFQASLLREEARPVTFRLILAEPGRFPAEQGPPTGLHRLELGDSRPLNPLELRRLSPAANVHRSMIGVRVDPEEGLRIWGIIHSGLNWLQNIYGGRGHTQVLPEELVVTVTGAGRLAVGFGADIIARFDGTRITGPSLNIYQANWLSRTFAESSEELMEIHSAARAKAGVEWAQLDPGLIRTIATHMMRRMISAVRSSGHGGTIVIIPPEMATECCGSNQFINVKYRLAEGEPRRRFRSLLNGIMNRLASLHGEGGEVEWDRAQPVGWKEYLCCSDEKLSAMDDGIFEMAHLIAGCTEVDGAVVLTKRFELLGFGGEISGLLPNVEVVHKARDMEGLVFEEESTESVGTRHRSTYRLCRAIPESLAIVVSQDGGVRFVKYEAYGVTFWDQSSTSSLDV
ncbi:MAG: hypothetical protein JSR82_01215 [Verrucomicrobia bacterium]|nr:hypothetical protein [Verrucomicrobiota bacterium]